MTVFNEVNMTEIVLPQHTNPIGVIFGGVLMSWIDIASAIAASRHCKSHVTTASIDALKFIKPIRLGWIVNINAKVNRVWNTSLEVGVKVLAENPIDDTVIHTATAYLTMVALNESGEAMKAPDYTPKTEKEILRYQQAEARRIKRLAL